MAISDTSPTPILDYYNDRSLLVVGGAGLTGTVLCYKLVTCCPKVKHIYILVRGGEERLWKHWTTHLEETQLTTLRNSNLITAIDGDACNPNDLGITDPELLSTLRSTVSIIVNLANKPCLAATLLETKATTIDPALHVAAFALSFAHLSRFVYTSSAYVNSHLHLQHDGLITTIAEELYPADPREYRYLPTAPVPSITLTTEQLSPSAEEEYATLSSTGTTPIYSAGVFPSSYTYAKHLAERLIISRYPPRGLSHILLFRPACIGPALREPYPTFEILGSAPVTTLISATIATPTDALVIPTRTTTAADGGPAGLDALIDEIPVDLCTNQLIAHIAVGTTGPVHAIAGPGEEGAADPRLCLQDYWEEYANCVPYVQRPVDIEWLPIDAVLRHIPPADSALQLKPLVRMYSHLGSTFNLGNGKTRKLWEGMGEMERELLPLWVVGREEALCALRLRKKRTAQVITAGFKGLELFADMDGKEVEARGVGSSDGVELFRREGVMLPVGTALKEGTVVSTFA